MLNVKQDGMICCFLLKSKDKYKTNKLQQTKTQILV